MASKEDYNDLSSVDSDSSSSSGFSHFDSTQEDINVPYVNRETAFQSTIGLTLEVYLEIYILKTCKVFLCKCCMTTLLPKILVFDDKNFY